MAKFIVLFTALASVHGNAIDRAVGWGPGWTTTVIPAEAPTTMPPGWGPPAPSGWGAPPSNVNISLSGELTAVGSGWAAENHAENIQVTGGWGVPADLLVASGGESVLVQEGSIVQVTNVDDSSATSLNAVSVAQLAAADESLAVIASGEDVAVAQNGWSGVAGEGASAAVADTSILVNQ